MENELKRLDADGESNSLGLDVTSRISLAAAEQSASYYSSIDDANGSMGSSANNLQMKIDGGVDFDGSHDDFHASSSADTSFDYYHRPQRDRINNAVDGKKIK